MNSYKNITNFSTHKLCRLFLIHSLLYYVYCESVITDNDFDCICKELLKRLKDEDIPDEFEEFIQKEDLEAGSGYSIPFGSLPQRVLDCASILHSGKDFSGNKINIKDWIR